MASSLQYPHAWLFTKARALALVQPLLLVLALLVVVVVVVAWRWGAAEAEAAVGAAEEVAIIAPPGATRWGKPHCTEDSEGKGYTDQPPPVLPPPPMNAPGA